MKRIKRKLVIATATIAIMGGLTAAVIGTSVGDSLFQFIGNNFPDTILFR